MSGEQLRLETEALPAPDAQPTVEQATAIGLRDRDILLEAGAGTGKTTVLVERFCDAVCEDGTGVDAILAFTFTEKAAAQLRSRIRRELRNRSERAQDPELGERLREAVRGIEGAWISTIHGFCRRLLATHPIAAGLDPRFGVLDEPEADRLATQGFDAALTDLLADGNERRDAMVAAFRVRGLREMIRDAYDELRSLGHLEPRLPEVRIPDPEDARRRLAEAARAALAEVAPASGKKSFAGHFEKLGLAARASDPEGRPSDTELEPLAIGSSAADFAGPAIVAYNQAVEAAHRCVHEAAGSEEYGYLRELLEAFGRHYEEIKATRSGLDFEDLQVQAVRLLSEREGIRERYRERFAHIMVDEFQDTNRLQLELLRLLDGPETRLFAVGDAFQSIYRFRHADLRVFREERDSFETRPDSEARVLPLSGNFRSTPAVLAAVNALGEAILPDFSPITVGSLREPAGGPPSAVELLLTEEKGWDADGIDLEPVLDDATSPTRVAEARFLAERLRGLAAEGVERSQIVVLLRAFTHVGAYEEALERAGLAPYVVGGRGYWSHQQVEDVTNLLALVANPLDDQALLGALASPACGVLPDTLWLLRRTAGSGNHLWPALEGHFAAHPEQHASPIPDADAQRLRDFHATLTGLRDIAPVLGLEALIDRAMTVFGYDLAVLASSNGRRRMANIRKLMRMAREFESREGRDLRAFLDFVAERGGREEREAEAATEAEDHDGVRIMTVHAAKGLEFGVVAVADLGRDAAIGGFPPSLRLDRGTEEAAEAGSGDAEGAGPPVRVGIRLARLGRKAPAIFDYEELKVEAERDDAEEACRIAYVAATRAQDRLLLSGAFAPQRLAELRAQTREVKPSTSILDRLLVGLDAKGEDGETLELAAPQAMPGLGAALAPATLTVAVNRPTAENAGRLVRPGGGAPAAEGAVSGGEPPILAANGAAEPAVAHLSYSAIAGYERCGYRFYVERILGLGSDPAASGTGSDRGRSFGSAVHSLLEWSARNRWRAPGEDICRRLLRDEGLEGSNAEVSRAQELVGAWLGSELLAELTEAGARFRAELPFTLALGGVILRGKIDLLAELPGGDVAVIDFKTDRLDGAGPGARMGVYEAQRRLYALVAAPDGGGSVRAVYAFLEAAESPVETSFDAAARERARADLEELIARITAGEFEVSPEPHAGLCGDCPARAHLCSYDSELTLRTLPA